MTVREKIQSKNGYFSRHDAMDPSLKEKAQELLYEYNNTRPSENEKRSNILKELFGTCSPLTFVEPNFKCDYGFNIHTDGLVFINYNCVMLDTSPIHIGKNTFIGPGTCLSCAGHAIHPLERGQGIGTSKPITIQEDVWIGANSTICSGVTIGKGSIIGAGSVVTKDIPQGVIAVGNPCKVMRKITEGDKLNLKEDFVIL